MDGRVAGGPVSFFLSPPEFTQQFSVIETSLLGTASRYVTGTGTVLKAKNAENMVYFELQCGVEI